MKLDRPRPRIGLAGLIVALALFLAGCASTGAAVNQRDPWEPFNRRVHTFNEDADRIVLKPAATWYQEKVPALVRTGVANFFGNLSDAWSAVNLLLQLRLPEFEENLARVHLNTMFGLFGILDVASDFDIDRHREDFGQTLGRWGVPAGPYVVLPLLGPSTLRDAAALPIESRYDLLRRIDASGLRVGSYTLRAVDRRANLLRVSSVLEEAALDKYSFTRDAYLQRRRAQVQDSRGEEREIPPPLPDESR